MSLSAAPVRPTPFALSAPPLRAHPTPFALSAPPLRAHPPPFALSAPPLRAGCIEGRYPA